MCAGIVHTHCGILCSETASDSSTRPKLWQFQFPPSHGNTQSSDSSEASLHAGTHQHFYTLTQMTSLAGESCQCVVSLELCFWPEEGDTTVTLARFCPTLHEQVLPPVRLLTSHNYRHIDHCVRKHSGGVKTVRLFSELAGQEAIDTNFEIQAIQFRNKKKLVYHDCSNIGTGCLISILGDIQNSLGQGPEQGLDSMISRCPCQLSGCVSRTFPSLGHRTVCSQSVSGCYCRCSTSSTRSFPQPLPFVISHLEFIYWQRLLPKESTHRGGRLYIILNRHHWHS